MTDALDRNVKLAVLRLEATLNGSGCGRNGPILRQLARIVHNDRVLPNKREILP
jgi:hypothetical protein